jgi:hypothetical protein
MADARDVAVAGGQDLVWVTGGGADNIVLVSQLTDAAVQTVVTPAGAVPNRMAYNHAAGEMVVGFAGTSQVAVYDAATGALVSLYSIPPAINGGVSIWNGVLAIRPTASGDARAYMMYDDPVPANADRIGTLHLPTGAITTVGVGVGEVTPASPNGLAYDTLRDGIGRSYVTGGLLVAERRHPVTLAVVAGPAGVVGASATGLFYEQGNDAYHLSDGVGGNVFSFDGGITFSLGGPTAVPAAGKVVATSP